MSLHLRAEAVGESAVDIAREKLTQCLELCDADEGLSPTAVHSVRKNVKWLRALTRLLRSAVARDARKRFDHLVRDAARSLSEAREAAVRHDTLEKLGKRYPSITELRALASAQAPTSLGSVNGKKASHLLEEALEAASMFGDSTFEDVQKGLRRGYKKSRRALTRCLAHDDVADAPFSERLHQWRKQVKRHMHHVEMVVSLAPDSKERAGRTHDLATLLGNAHDLDDLREYFFGRHEDPPPAATPEVKRLLDARESELALEALLLGRTLFERTPGDFSSEIHWENAESGS